MKRLDKGELFLPPTCGRELARRSVVGGAATLAEQGILFILRLAAVASLARILSPSDYGLMAMMAVALNFFQLIKDAGLGAATVQQGTISHEQVSSLFWVNSLIGLLIALAILAGAPLFAWFFKRGELTAIAAVSSASVFIGGLVIQHEALLRRHMRFSELAFIHVAAALSNWLAALALALLGWRYWALVAGALLQSLVATLLAFYFCRWRPGAPRRGTGARGMLRFGGHLTGFNLANYFARNADNMLIGRYLGAQALGLYSRAYQLLMMPIAQVRAPLDQVAMPALSSLRGDPQRYARYYRGLLDLYLLIMMPIVFLSALEAEFLVTLLLGRQWLGMVPVFRILALAGLLQVAATTRGLVMVSSGQSRRYLRWGLVNSALTVSAFIAGLPFGIEGVAGAYVIANYVILVPSLYYCFRGTAVTVPLFLRAFFSSLLAALPAAAGVVALDRTFASRSPVMHGMYVAVFLTVFILLSWLRPSVREAVGRVLGELRVTAGPGSQCGGAS
jgi:O-antigen/teichoic acid export membrane protein